MRNTKLAIHKMTLTYLLTQVDEEGKVLVPAAAGCALGFSAVASPELLEEWNFRGSRPATARHLRKIKK